MVCRRIVAAVVLLCAGVLPGAVSAEPPKALAMGTSMAGGTYFMYGGALARLLSAKLGIAVTAQPTQGASQNIILVETKKLALGITGMGVALQAWEGRAEWTQGKKLQAIRALFPLYGMPFHFAVPAQSAIGSVEALDGTRVGAGPQTGTPGTYLPLMLETLGINVDWHHGMSADMVGKLAEGQIDCYAFAANLPVASLVALEARRALRFFSFSPAQIKTLTEKMPELSDAVVAKGKYAALAADQQTVGVFNFLVVHIDMADDLAYRITRAVLDHGAELAQDHAAAAETVAANWVHNRVVPFHPGAARYYKEKGITLPRHLR